MVSRLGLCGLPHGDLHYPWSLPHCWFMLELPAVPMHVLIVRLCNGCSYYNVVWIVLADALPSPFSFCGRYFAATMSPVDTRSSLVSFLMDAFAATMYLPADTWPS